jgi:ADP-ribosylglycohydrolase
MKGELKMHFITKIYRDEKSFGNLSKEAQREILQEYKISKSDIEYIVNSENVYLGARENNIKFDLKYLRILCCPDVFNKKNIKRTETSKETVLKGIITGNSVGLPYNTINKIKSHKSDNSLVNGEIQFNERIYFILAIKNAIEENDKKPDFIKHFELMDKAYPEQLLGNHYKSKEQWGSNMAATITAYIGACYEDVRDVINQSIRCATIFTCHRDGIIGAISSATCIWMALHNYTDKEIYDYMQRIYSFKDDSYLYLFQRQCMFNVIRSAKNQGTIINECDTQFACYTVPFAFKLFYETQGYKNCLEEMVKKRGDIDAFCSIAGGIAAAYYNDTEIKSDEMKIKMEVLNM